MNSGTRSNSTRSSQGVPLGLRASLETQGPIWTCRDGPRLQKYGLLSWHCRTLLAFQLLCLLLDLPVLAWGLTQNLSHLFALCWLPHWPPRGSTGEIIAEDSGSLLQLGVGNGGKPSLGVSQAVGAGW